MIDGLPIYESGVMGVVAKLSEFDIESLDPAISEKLIKENKPQLQELGQFLRSSDFGPTAEYYGRVARAREVVGLELPAHETDIRDRFTWGPGDVVELRDLLAHTRDNEELQFTDYKGRMYNIIKKGSELVLLEAYDEAGKPLTPNGRKLNGKIVTIGRLKTWFEQTVKLPGVVSNEQKISLVEKDVEITRTQYGEEYVEIRNGIPYNTAASRMKIFFPELKNGWGVLVSKIDLVAADQEEVKKLNAANWRIADSIAEIKKLVGTNKSSIEVDNERIENIIFGNDNDISFEVVRSSEKKPQKTEYHFSTRNGHSEKVFSQMGREWMAFQLPGQAEEGSTPIHPIEAARILDQFRYKILKSRS